MSASRPNRLGAPAIAVLASALMLLTACVPEDYRLHPNPISHPRLDLFVLDLEGVADVLSQGAASGPAPLSVVIVEVGASQEQVTAIARETRDYATGIRWDGKVELRRAVSDPYDPDLDLSTSKGWQVEIFPAESDGWSGQLAGFLEADERDGVVGTSSYDDWPTAMIRSMDDFSTEFHRLSATPEYSRGGTYSLAYSDHLRIVHVPSRSSDELIDEIIQIAIVYPDAEVLLEATTYAPQVPTLYIARLTAEQAAELDARLRDPAFADADVQGYPVQFVLTVSTADGPVYTVGNLGDVPPL